MENATEYRSAFSRRHFLRHLGVSGFALGTGLKAIGEEDSPTSIEAQPLQQNKPPNILFCISDDQSWPHASAYGSKMVRTPSFDQVAGNGALFNACFAPSPSCSPTRASILTGRNIWQNQEAGVHGSIFPAQFPVFTHILEANGYNVAFTGKGWGPGNWRGGGENVARKRNPVGKKIAAPNGYVESFEHFMSSREPGRPFFFWFGSRDPHRSYDATQVKQGSADRTLEVPKFLADGAPVRCDLAGYAHEIERFDGHLGQLLNLLKDHGEYDNTIVVVTSDNGMPFPRAKMHCYEYGTHVPLAVQWPAKMPGGRTVDDLISLIDFAPTFLEAAGITPPQEFTGRSLMTTFRSPKNGLVDPTRTWVLTGKERHSPARSENACYPVRTIRTREFLYIRNLKPDRWPAGDPPHYLDLSWSDHPTRVYYNDIQGQPEMDRYVKLVTERRPAEELYDIRRDPWCMTNLAANKEYIQTKQDLWTQLKEKLSEQKDPRLSGKGDCFDNAPSVIKDKVGFAPPMKSPKFDHTQDKPWLYAK